MKAKLFIPIVILVILGGKLNAQDFRNSVKLNIAPAGGYRILTDDSATNLLPGLRDYEVPRFGIGAGLEYTRVMKDWFSMSFGLDYQYFEYGGITNFSTYDSINNFTSAGTVRTAYEHHYIGVPIKFYFNVVNKEKFRYYLFVGVVPKVHFARYYSTEYTDTVNSTTYSLHEDDPAPGKERNVFNLEAQVGMGINFNLSKRWILDLNGFFGMNVLKSNKNTPINEYIYRFGGTVGIGYRF